MLGLDNGFTAQRFLPLFEQLGQSEVQNFHGTAIAYKNIGRLDVAVHDALFMRHIERVSELDANLQNAGNR